jgi:hypothetical protein
MIFTQLLLFLFFMYNSALRKMIYSDYIIVVYISIPSQILHAAMGVRDEPHAVQDPL